MEKKSGDNDRREERTKASAASKSTIGGGGGGGGGGGAPVPGLDPHALFAHSMFGGLPGSFNPLAQLSMLGQSPYGALAPPTSSSASNAYNNASAAAWWSMASQLAAQDYLARLQASTATRGFPGYPGLVPDPLLAAGYDLLAHRTPKQGGSKSSKNQNSSASTSKETSGGRSSKSDASTPSTSNSKASALGSLRLPPDTEIIHYHQQQQSSSTPSPAASLADSLQPPPPPKNSSSSGRSSNSNSHGKHHHKTTLPPELASVSASPGSLPAQSSTTTTPKSSQGTPTASMHTSTPNSYYPFLHMPYPFMNTPLTHSTPLPSSDKKSRKTDKEASLDTGANSSTTPVPSSSSSTPRSSTRGQLVNGKPLALDVSSLIAKPSTSAELPNDDAPLNLCVKARDGSPRPTEEKVRRKPGPKSRSSKPVEPLPPDVPFSALSMFGPSFGLLPKTPDPKVTPPKASKSNSHSKKNTVASLLAQSRNGSARSPASEGNDGRSSSRVSANGDGAASPTDSLSSASHSAFQDLLRAANLSLGQIGALPSASNESTSTNGHGDDMDQDSGDDSSFDDDTDDGEGENGDEGGGGGGGDGSKTSTDRHSGDGGSRKRRKFITDETVLRLPLTMGWRRETIIRSLGKSGVRGEVTYFAPCGRRLRQYPDVARYLERQGIAGITRNNFSFSTRVILGEFIQPIGDNPDRGIRLSEPEVHRLVDQIRAARGWRPRPKRMNREEREALARQREAQRAQQRLEAQEMARQAQEAKLQQRMERERALQVAKETRRLLKEQEKQERQEAARRERELRNQQLMEARKKRQEELEKQREEEQLRKIQERERRRQHMALVKALEMRKKFEEREKKKEELRLEKKASKEKRAEERRLELEASKDVKKPVEDMELLDHKPIPKLKRIPGMKLPGKAFADLLMVFEFLHTFGETLGFDMESLPNLDSLQKAMLYDPEAEEELLSVICHLLVCAIEDPGIPHPNRHTTVLGQTLKQADITTNNVSEILRLYLVANALGDAKPPSEKAGNKEVVYENQEAFTLSEWLKHKPFLSLSPSEKGSILSFLIHELLQNKAVIGQIEQSIEGQNTARRDRWIVDSKIRKLKTLHAKKSKSSHSFSKAEASCEESHEETNQSLQEGKEHKKKEDAEEENDEDDDKDDSGGEEDLHDAENHEEEEDRNLAPDELKKKMERLSRQSNQILTQLTVSDQQLRALALGQDRYRRRYWILPHGGGVFVEACESCEAPAAGFVSWEGLPPPLIQKGLSEDTEEEMKKEENAPGEEMDKKPKIEPMEMDEAAPKLATAGAATEANESTGEQKEPKLEEQPDKENIEEPSAAQEAVKQEPKQVDEEEAEEQAKIQTAEGQEPLPLQQQQPPQQQPQQMKLPVISPKKTVPDPDRPWFSILPREPCDDETLASLNAHDMHPMDEPMTPMTDTSERFCSEGKNRDHFEAPYARPETPRPVQPMPEGLALGWWRITEPEVLKKILESLHPRGVREREFHRLLSRYMDFASDSTSKLTEKNTLSGGDPKCMGLSTETPDPDPVKLVDIWSRETALRVDLLMLEQIESFEDRIASASMQVKGWKLPSRASCELGYKFRPICEPSTEENAGTVTPLEIARERLINVEAAIERRYLKAPLGHRVVNGKGEVVLNFLSGGPSLSETPKGLVTWREATKKCETSAQLAMCFYMLETSVAWDKSIMKASCQFCHGGDKEDQLLLCDGCDRGYHTYCFKPPMTTIPEGDWFCYECINRAVMERNCIVCGKPGQKNIVFCDACPKAYHIDCLQNPLAKVPRGKWYCQLCQHTKAPPKKKARKSAPATVSTPPRDRERVSESEPCTAPAISTSTPTPTPQPVASQESNGEVLGVNGNGENTDAPRAGSPVASIASPPPPPPPPAPPTKKERSAAVAKRNALAKEKDLTPCKVLLDDLEVHDESWPFLLPVNTKQFPTYKKIIKNPMDLSTIRKKLNDGVYKTREEFCADVRLIFHNCEIFNEDDSPVGKAGHSMRVFFDARWPELTGSGH